MTIAIDFDGTCVTHEYPNIGREVEGCVDVLKELVHEGHKLILYTMRSGKHLKEAKDWFKEREIPLWGVNENPTQNAWTTSPKIYANLYIDDAACGCPLIYDKTKASRPFVDWNAVKIILLRNGFINYTKSESQRD